MAHLKIANGLLDNKQNLSVSKAIDILRFPLAVFVVAIHTYFNEGLKARGNVDVPFSGVWAHEFIRFFSITLTDCAVPMFFVISGFLYFWKTSHLTKDIYCIKTQKKIIALMVPFFCWNLITCLINPSRFLSAGLMEKITGFWSMTMEFGHGAGPWDGPLWFVRDLFIVMLCAPVVEWVVRKIKLGGGSSSLYSRFDGIRFYCSGIVSSLIFVLYAWGFLSDTSSICITFHSTEVHLANRSCIYGVA